MLFTEPAMVPEGGPDMFITVHPDPLVEGKQGKVCYDFAGSGQTQPVVLFITWTLIDGTDVTDSVTVDPKSPCHAVTPPAGAATVNIRDTSGVSVDYGGSVALPTPPIG
jgi:hypothetical protein